MGETVLSGVISGLCALFIIGFGIFQLNSKKARGVLFGTRCTRSGEAYRSARMEPQPRYSE